MAAHKTGAQKTVLAYLQKLGLKDSKNPEQFWNDLYRKYSKSLVDSLQDIMEQRSEKLCANPYIQDLYLLKNQDRNLSLDFAAYSADLYRRFFDWCLTRKNPVPRRILDIGSDNGIVTCFLAMLYPEAEVIGIDPCRTSVACARELAQKLGCANVSFHQTTLAGLKDLELANSFDLIISVRTLHEILGSPPQLEFWSLADIEVKPAEDDCQLRTVQNFLRDENSEFISWERLFDCGTYVWWAKKLENAGLYVNWDKCQLIRFHEVGDFNTMPVFVAGINPNIDNITVHALKLYLSDHFVDPTKTEYDDWEAEYIFHSSPARELFYGFQVNYINGAGKMRLEGWRSKDKVLLYQYGNMGFRRLTIFPGDMAAALQEHLAKSQQKFQTNGNEVKAVLVPSAHR